MAGFTDNLPEAIRSFDRDREPVYLDDAPVGYVTSGGFGHRTAKSLALAYLDADAIRAAEQGATFEVPLVGRRSAASLTAPCVFDPAGERMRS